MYILIYILAVLFLIRPFEPYAQMSSFTKRKFEKVWKGEELLFENLMFHVFSPLRTVIKI